MAADIRQGGGGLVRAEDNRIWGWQWTKEERGGLGERGKEEEKENKIKEREESEKKEENFYFRVGSGL